MSLSKDTGTKPTVNDDFKIKKDDRSLLSEVAKDNKEKINKEIEEAKRIYEEKQQKEKAGFTPAFKFIYCIVFLILGYLLIKSGGFNDFGDYIIAFIVDIIGSFIGTAVLIMIFAFAMSLNDK